MEVGAEVVLGRAEGQERAVLALLEQAGGRGRGRGLAEMRFVKAVGEWAEGVVVSNVWQDDVSVCIFRDTFSLGVTSRGVLFYGRNKRGCRLRPSAFASRFCRCSSSILAV